MLGVRPDHYFARRRPTCAFKCCVSHQSLTVGQQPRIQAVARQWPGRRKTLKKWGQLYVFSTCMTIKAQIRSNPAGMPRKSPDRGPDGIRHGQDPKSEDSCTFSAPPTSLRRVPRQRPGSARQLPGSCPAVARQEKNLEKVGTVARFQHMRQDRCYPVPAGFRLRPAVAQPSQESGPAPNPRTPESNLNQNPSSAGAFGKKSLCVFIVFGVPWTALGGPRRLPRGA